MKEEFHGSVIRDSTKTKIQCLMSWKKRFIKTMKHEEKLNKLFNKNKLIGLIFNHGKLWADLAFLTNLTINIIIVASYSGNFATDPENHVSVEFARKYEPRFFLKEEFDQTLTVIKIFGIANILFSALVVFFFLIKRAPLIVLEKNVWKGFWVAKIKKLKRLLLFIWKSSYSFYLCLSDFDFVYYMLYILFAIGGLVIHPFLFCFQLTDFLRIDLLKNVVKAVWIPRKQLLLTFLVFILEEYYFSLLSYIFLYDQYINTIEQQIEDAKGEQKTITVLVEYCASYWLCWLTTFDNTFKV